MADKKKRRPSAHPQNIKRPQPAYSVNLVESTGRVNPGSQVRKGRTVAPGTVPQRRYTTADQYDRQYGPQSNETYYDSLRPPTGPVNPRLYERDIIDQVVDQTRNRNPGPVNNPGYQSPFGDTGGGGGIGGEVVPEEPPVDPEQAAFIARLMAMRDETLAGYGPSAQAIKGYYDTASQDLADPYNDYMNKARSGAQNLGLNFASDDNVKLADLAARKLQENYDLNETTDLATVEKMKGINRDSFTQMLVAAEAGLLGPQVAADQLALANAGGGGGGGGGSGGGGSGGGSSGNPFSEKATQDEAFYNPGMVSAISGIADPQLRDYADLVYAGTGTNPRAALNRSVADYEKFANFRPPAPTARRGSNVLTNMANTTQRLISQAKKKKATDDMKIAQAAINFFKNWSPGYRPQTVSQKVQTTSTTKNS